ncbi:IS5 family transposase [Microbacterium imperiale]|nr:IS5 family transposase [Microbacterium imperiale]
METARRESREHCPQETRRIGLDAKPVSTGRREILTARQTENAHLIRCNRTCLEVCDGRGRPLSWVITGANINDTTMMTATLEQIHVPRAVGRPRRRPDRVLADKGYPSKKNRAWLRERKIAATIPERDDQIAHRRRKPGRPIDFGEAQQERYKGRNVVERCFNKLKQWRGIAMRSDKTARSYRAAIALAATLIWIKTDLIHTA